LFLYPVHGPVCPSDCILAAHICYRGFICDSEYAFIFYCSLSRPCVFANVIYLLTLVDAAVVCVCDWTKGDDGNNDVDD
jgi:hypothetical protein